jgi:methylenetetrahydrofolate dehydrogenase (NADP+)/methenyltetrahydrofolate cyclohydrolase
LTDILRGKPIVDELRSSLKARVAYLKAKDIVPTLATVRVGTREDDIAYEATATRMIESVDARIMKLVLDAEVTQEELISTLRLLNTDDNVHGILLFKPLPSHLDEDTISNRIDVRKDVDGITDLSMSSIYAISPKDFIGKSGHVHLKHGYAPCTAEAVIKMLDHYNIDISGKSVCVIGRSLVIGKPVSHLLTARNATVTMCHTGTKDVAAIAKHADILVAASGQGYSVDRTYMKEGSTIVDVGIHVDDDGNLYGDVVTSEAIDFVSAISPVPFGIGSITSITLVEHTVISAEQI